MICDMNTILILLILASAAGLVATTRTRAAQIARMAKTNGCRFEREKNSITTEQTAGRLEFFTQYFHQYHVGDKLSMDQFLKCNHFSFEYIYQGS